MLSAPLLEIKEAHRVGERLLSLDEIFVAKVGVSESYVGSTSNGVDATRVMWEFFRAHPRKRGAPR